MAAIGGLSVQRKQALSLVIVLMLAGCGGSELAETPPEPERRPTVFDPLTGTLDRAQGVQQTLDAQAAEQRRRIEDAER
jgi:hypothetical protein